MVALEARLGRGKVNQEQPLRRVVRLCSDGKRRACAVPLNKHELSDWFWGMARINNKSGCWEWIGSLHHSGTACFKHRGKFHIASRHAAFEVLGCEPILHVLHTCDNRACINPSHLWLGTDADNSNDKVMKGRQFLMDPQNAHNAKLTWKDVERIRKENMTSRQVMDAYGITQSAAHKVRHGYTWKTA